MEELKELGKEQFILNLKAKARFIKYFIDIKDFDKTSDEELVSLQKMLNKVLNLEKNMIKYCHKS